MSTNLGLYQDLTVAAKAAGGVPQYIEKIQRAAVSKAAPGIGGVGAAVGAVAGAAVVAGLVAGRNFMVRRKADQVEAEEAKRRLVSEHGNDGSQPGGSANPIVS